MNADDRTTAERFALTAWATIHEARATGDTEAAHWAQWIWGMLATPRLIDDVANRPMEDTER